MSNNNCSYSFLQFMENKTWIILVMHNYFRHSQSKMGQQFYSSFYVFLG